MTQPPAPPVPPVQQPKVPPVDPTNPCLMPTNSMLNSGISRADDGTPWAVLTIRNGGGESTAFHNDPDVLDRWAQMVASLAQGLREAQGNTIVAAPANTPLPPLAHLFPGAAPQGPSSPFPGRPS